MRDDAAGRRSGASGRPHNAVKHTTGERRVGDIFERVGGRREQANLLGQ
jgi:hypothetical protein